MVEIVVVTTESVRVVLIVLVSDKVSLIVKVVVEAGPANVKAVYVPALVRAITPKSNIIAAELLIVLCFLAGGLHMNNSTEPAMQLHRTINLAYKFHRKSNLL